MTAQTASGHQAAAALADAGMYAGILVEAAFVLGLSAVGFLICLLFSLL